MSRVFFVEEGGVTSESTVESSGDERVAADESSSGDDRLVATTTGKLSKDDDSSDDAPATNNDDDDDDDDDGARSKPKAAAVKKPAPKKIDAKMEAKKMEAKKTEAKKMEAKKMESKQIDASAKTIDWEKERRQLEEGVTRKAANVFASMEKKFEDASVKIATRMEKERRKAMEADVQRYGKQMETMMAQYEQRMQKQWAEIGAKRGKPSASKGVFATFFGAKQKARDDSDDSAESEVSDPDARVSDPDAKVSDTNAKVSDTDAPARKLSAQKLSAQKLSAQKLSAQKLSAAKAKRAATKATASDSSKKKPPKKIDEAATSNAGRYNLRSTAKPEGRKLAGTANDFSVPLADDDDLGGWGSELSDEALEKIGGTPAGEDKSGEAVGDVSVGEEVRMHVIVDNIINTMQDLPELTHEKLDELWVGLDNINLDGPTSTDIPDVLVRQARLLCILTVLYDKVSEESNRTKVLPDMIYSRMNNLCLAGDDIQNNHHNNNTNYKNNSSALFDESLEGTDAI